MSDSIEAAAKRAFRAAQTEYRAEYDHFPIKHTWETTDESVREMWRRIAEAAVRKEPCSECHLQPGETCDICGARATESGK